MDIREFDEIETKKVIGNYIVTIRVEKLEGTNAGSEEEGSS
mgnify:FL=1|jgi:hypothetical protein